MISKNDELGGKYFGDFVHPNGDPIVRSKEVKENQDNNKIRFFIAREISKTIGIVIGLVKEGHGDRNSIIRQIQTVIGKDDYLKTFKFVN